MSPPDLLTAPRPQPPFFGQTCMDLALYAAALREWGAACELDKAAIRQWEGDDAPD